MTGITPYNFLKRESEINPAFDKENIQENRKSKIEGWLTTILFHVLLLLIFYFLFTLKPPFPPLSEQGVYLNIGIADAGMGTMQPEGTSTQLEIPSRAPVKQSTPSKSNDVLTQDTKEDVPVIQKKEVTKKPAPPAPKTATTKTTTPVNTVPPEPKPKALYPGNKSNGSTGEGTTHTLGDQGKANGSPGGTEYSGNPGAGNGGSGGNGIAQLGMSGRKIVSYPTIIDNSQKTGRVVVNIKVGRDGSVIFAKATQKGSTTTDSYLYQLAEDGAMRTKVNADDNAAEEQFGTITFTFRVK